MINIRSSTKFNLYHYILTFEKELMCSYLNILLFTIGNNLRQPICKFVKTNNGAGQNYYTFIG